jgi:ubiquitin C-terminal hydrolase
MKFSPPLFKICTGLAIIIFTINQGMQSGANFDNSDSFENNRTKIEIKANRGNTNAENSCFLNSVIQALYHLEPFRFTFEPELIESVQSERLNQDIIDDNDYYADQENTIKLKNITDPVIEYSKDSVPKALIQHIATMARSNPDEGDPIDPSAFREKFSFYSSATMEFCDGQHDAAEFYTLLIDQLWQQIVPMKKARDGFLQLFKTGLSYDYDKHKSNIEYLWEFIAGELHKETILYPKDNTEQEERVLLTAVNSIQKKITDMIRFQASSKKDSSDYDQQLYLSVLFYNNEINKNEYGDNKNSWLYKLIPPLADTIRFRNETMKKLLGSTVQLPLTCTANKNHTDTRIKNKPSPWLWTLTMGIDEGTNLKKLMTDNQFIPENDAEGQCKTKGCNGSLASTGKINLIEPPDILTIQLARFTDGAKNNQLFDIPEKLYSDNNDVSWEGNFHYKLYAVVVQRGGMQSGHYWAYARDSNDSWYCYNDQPGEKTSIKTDGADYTLEQDGTTYGVFKNKEVEQMTEEEIEKILKPQYKTQEESSKNGVNADIWPTPYMLFYVKTQGSEDEELSKQLETEEEETPGEFEAKDPQPIFNQVESPQQVLVSEDGKKIVPQNQPQPINQSEQNINQQATPPITATQKAEKQQPKDSTSPEEPGFFASIASSAANAIQWVAQTLWSIVSLPFRWLFGS